MHTNINAKQLAIIYGMSQTSYQRCINAHRDKLRDLAIKYIDPVTNKECIRYNYSSAQLKYIVETVMQGTPMGYEFNGQTLVKTTTDN